jgi:hypothetical protein
MTVRDLVLVEWRVPHAVPGYVEAQLRAPGDQDLLLAPHAHALARAGLVSIIGTGDDVPRAEAAEEVCCPSVP